MTGVPAAAHAQQWNDERTMALVDAAIARRAAQLADSGLANYRATAHGSLTFLGQVGQGFPDPPKVVRTDELAVEVYWRAPNQSKQLIVGRRDSLLLPADIQYHTDHLAIVQNNFPSIIRLGDGDEVRDVPHPLSALGRTIYDFAITDSLTIRTNDRAFDVVMVNVRPKDPSQPRAVGAVYLDRANGTVVRMTFSFTRAALKDEELEDVSIILENGLVDGRFWLPRRQEIEIRRTGSWLEFPVRGIIRGRWEICCVEVNTGVQASFFQGPEIVSLPPDRLKAYPFTGKAIDAIPGDVKLAGNDDVRRVQDAARALVRADALARVERTALSAPAISDILRVNRIEGLAVGGGAFAESRQWILGRRARAIRHRGSRVQGSADRGVAARERRRRHDRRARRLPFRGRRTGGERRPQQHRGPGIRHGPDGRLPVARIHAGHRHGRAARRAMESLDRHGPAVAAVRAREAGERCVPARVRRGLGHGVARDRAGVPRAERRTARRDDRAGRVAVGGARRLRRRPARRPLELDRADLGRRRRSSARSARTGSC